MCETLNVSNDQWLKERARPLTKFTDGADGAKMNQIVPFTGSHSPALVKAAGDRAAYGFLEFFTAQIRNPHTRRAYVRAVGAFCTWLVAHGVPSIAAVGSIHVAAYVEDP